MDTIEFGTGLRARLATDRAIAPVDQRPIYELLRDVDLPAVHAVEGSLCQEESAPRTIGER